MHDLERKVEWLTAMENIRTVIARYALAGDHNNDPEQLALLLTADAVWACEGFGRFQGRDNICRELATVGRERIVWSLHYPVAPIIDVHESLQRAHAFWWLWELTTMRNESGEEQPNWLGATYNADFVREADGWKVSNLVLDIKQMVPYTLAPPA